MGVLKKENSEMILDQLTELPTLPLIIGQLTKLVNNPMASRSQIVQVIEHDQALASKVLKLINSGYYAIPGGVKSLDRAIVLLGFEQVYQLVLSTSIIQTFSAKDSLFSAEEFWRHSMGVAVIAKHIGELLSHQDPGFLFLAGLVHDIGKLILLKISRETLMSISSTAKAKRVTFTEAEDLLGAPKHVQLGYLLAQKWNFPMSLRECIRFHHTNLAGRSSLSMESNHSINIVSLSNLLLHDAQFGSSGYEVIPSIKAEDFIHLNMSADMLEKLRTGMKDKLGVVDLMLKAMGSS